MIGETGVGEYKLKGVISEIKHESNKYQIKITGITGFSLKYGEETFNIFFNQDTLTHTPKSIMTALSSSNSAKIISCKHYIEYNESDQIVSFLSNCFVNNKPIEVTIEEDSKKNTYTIKSITALAN